MRETPGLTIPPRAASAGARPRVGGSRPRCVRPPQHPVIQADWQPFAYFASLPLLPFSRAMMYNLSDSPTIEDSFPLAAEGLSNLKEKQ